MKALILAGGKGTRLRPITFSMAKQLVPVANKPVIEYGIEAIAAAGVKDFGIIVADTAKAIEEVVGDGSRFGIKVTYIPQPDPLGLAHAVATAKDFLGHDDFIMYLGDNMIKSSLSDLVSEFKDPSVAATILLTPVPNPSDFGVAELKDGIVSRLQEKPKDPKSNLALVGVYLFRESIHDHIAHLKPSARGEFEITDAIQSLVDGGLNVHSHIVQGWWKDTGTVEAMLEANRLILEDMPTDIQGQVDEDSRIEGRVVLAKGCKVVNSVIRGPAVIGANCHIENSYIGPFSAIDSGTTLKDTEIEYSIVLQDCELVRPGARIEASLIGRGAKVGHAESVPKSMQLVLGDSSQVTLP